MTCGIYGICHVASGRWYVGQSKNIKWRWRAHRNDLERNDHWSTHLQNAWNKYGSDAFTWHILEETPRDAAVLCAREQYWMDTKRAHQDKGGFNLYPAAGSPLGYKHTEETKKKMAENCAQASAIRAELRETDPEWRERERERLAMAAAKGRATQAVLRKNDPEWRERELENFAKVSTKGHATQAVLRETDLQFRERELEALAKGRVAQAVLRETDPEWRERELENLAKAGSKGQAKAVAIQAVLRETDPEWRERELENLAKATAAHVNLKHTDPVTFKQWRAQRSAVTRGVSPRGPNTMRAQVIRLLTTTGGTIENVEAILLRRYTEVGSMPKNSLRRRALGMIKVIRAYNGYDLETDPATGVIRATQRRVLRKTQKAPKSAQRASLALA